MNAIRDIDPNNNTITIKASYVLQTVQQAASDADKYFPLSLAAEGSCMIGGNLSTNAGGNRVVKYGMMRDMVLGLEAVLADGTVISSMNHLIYDFALILDSTA